MKNAIITGGSRGIGRAIAVSLASAGYNLFLVAQDAERISKTAESVSKDFNVEVKTLTCDLATPDAGTEIAHAVRLAGIVPDALILNAGTYLEGEFDPPQLLEDPFEVFERTMQVNCFSVLRCVQALVGDLRNGNGKRVIIIGSTAAYEAYAFGPAYGVSKWAIRGLAVNLRQELKHHNIGVTLVNPGGTLTDLWAGEPLPPHRLLDPSDIGEVVKMCMGLSEQAVVEEIIVRPMLGDIHS